VWESLSLPVLALIFAASGAAIWVAGIQLSSTVDVLATRLNLGAALGGVLLLAIATDLPEVAITASAALDGRLDIATGNLLGGVAIQTVVLVAVDAFGVPAGKPLTYRAASLVLVLEGGLVCALLVVAILGTQLPGSLVFAHLTPATVLIPVLWLVGIWLVSRARNGLPWHDESGTAPDGQEIPRGSAEKMKERRARERGHGTGRVALIFGLAALATLIAGVAIERSGEQIAGSIGMQGVLFGATILAAATALPELSTGLASAKLGDYQLAVSDIFGGNAFLPVLFLLATLLSGQAVLPAAQDTDIYLTALGILLTLVYITGLIFRPQLRIARMGVDSLVVLALYAAGLAGLIAVASG
jgi:cation:H+ antiporter